MLGDIPPKVVTNVLRDLVKEGTLTLTPIACSGSRSSEIYSAGLLASGELTEIQRRLAGKDQLFNRFAMGKLAERYAHWLIWNAKVFHQGALEKTGNYLDATGEHKVDLKIRYRDDRFNVGDIIVEAKNHRETFYPTSEVFEKLIRDAIAHNAQPALMAAHISLEAHKMCAAIGIGVLELKRQLLPVEWEPGVEAMRDLIGPLRFEYCAKRLFQRNISEEAARDLDTISDPAWILTPAARWQSTKRIVAANPTMAWRELLNLIHPYSGEQLAA